MRGRIYLRTVARMRAGKRGDWVTDRPDHDRVVVGRLLSRIGYGGRKGHSAFLRLWRMGIRPPATRVTLVIKGFELTEQSNFRKLDRPVYCESGVTPGRRQGCACVPESEPCDDCVRFKREMNAICLPSEP
jgi:hypothetical protein